MATPHLIPTAKRLLDRMVTDYGHNDGIGSMSCSIYDTAWVSTVAKSDSTRTLWLFPECFNYILDTQNDDGGWESYATEVDGILNTAASLYSIKKHATSPYQSHDTYPLELEDRIERASKALQSSLDVWDVAASVNVGFEILVPAMLELLKNQGLCFDFSGSTLLQNLNNQKLSKFNPASLYGNLKLTPLHSLEAFIGKIDFDKTTHHKTFGSLMASPSSTAAYLMNRTSWDDEAESYLRRVFATSEGGPNGGFPSAYPSTYFEITWVTSTLLENGFDRSQLESSSLDIIEQILLGSLKEEGGLVGFAPHVGSDADDTAKTILTLNLLGQSVSPKSMLAAFEKEKHFATYAAERNPSFSANCNILAALLHVANPDDYARHIEKAVRFLCDYWWGSDSSLVDKWNISPQYSIMLTAQAMTSLLRLWNGERLSALSTDLIRDKVLVVLFQALTKTLQTQALDGSWGSHEETAYSIVALANLKLLLFSRPLESEIRMAIRKGRSFLLKSGRMTPPKPEYLWVEKVNYASDFLSESYILAALNVDLPPIPDGGRLDSIIDIPIAKLQGFEKFYSKIPLFAKFKSWELRASLIEGALFQHQLRHVRLDVFPRTNMDEDKYFEYIPFTWTSCNKLNGYCMSPRHLYEMMVISVLNFQADEFMEVATEQFDIGSLKHMIDNIFNLQFQVENQNGNGIVDFTSGAATDNIHGESSTTEDSSPEKKRSRKDLMNDMNGFANGQEYAQPQDSPNIAAELDLARTALTRFVRHVMKHPIRSKASTYDQSVLKAELKTFLLAHVDQGQDNENFGKQQISTDVITPFTRANQSFYKWVRTTSANHTSCPYSFAFMSCALGQNGLDCFQTVTEKYLAQDLCLHLATMCRMYNDFGSVARDRQEKNLNSVNFVEFGANGTATPDIPIKDELFRLAEYERDCWNQAMTRLDTVAQGDGKKKRTLRKLKMFCDVTDLYGQIYVARDIGTRTQHDGLKGQMGQ